MTQFKAYDAKHLAILGDKPLSLTWGKKRGAVSWNAIQMWNASVVLFEEDQCEHDIKMINNMIYQTDFNIKRSNRQKWVKRIINAHIQGSGYRSFQDGESTSWPKINASETRNISILELTDIIIKHREQVKLWKASRSFTKEKSQKLQEKSEEKPEKSEEKPEKKPETELSPLIAEDVESWEDL
jgi:hypothetical protein